MSKKFNCPACGAPMEYTGGELLFQNCTSCTVPVVVPSGISEPDRDREIETTVGMPPARVLEAESLTQIEEHLDREEARVEEEKESGRVADPILADSREVIENIVSGGDSSYPPGESSSPPPPDDAVPASGKSKSMSPPPAAITAAASAPATEPPPPALTEEILREVRAGNKIGAIKLYRETYGTSLVEAKQAVERTFVDIKGIAEKNAQKVSDEPPPEMSPIEKLTLVMQQLQAGDKILAVKTFRKEFRTDLHEAKNAVEQLAGGENVDLAKYIRESG